MIGHLVARVRTADRLLLFGGVAQQKRNVEALRASEEQLQIMLAREQEARRQAEQAVWVRDAFLAATSHDLRTPLATIVSLAVHGRVGKPFKNDDLYGLLARWLHRG
jgi:K+-sensing histidine kinase KdpD